MAWLSVIVCRCVLVRFFVEALVHRHFILERRQRVRLVAPRGLSALVLPVSPAVLVFAVGMVGIRIVVHVIALCGNLPVLAPGTPLDLVGGRVIVYDSHHLHHQEWRVVRRRALDVEL